MELAPCYHCHKPISPLAILFTPSHYRAWRLRVDMGETPLTCGFFEYQLGYPYHKGCW